MLTRRVVLGGLLAGIAAPALAKTTTAALAADLIAAAKLGGKIGFVVADAKTGRVLEAVNGAEPLPPASVAKAITALYALEHLGQGFRFGTRLLTGGPVRDGVVAGDLVLAGGGDPTLQTDSLGDMAAKLRQSGIRAVEGRFLVWGGALPYTFQIDRGQPEHVGYNPAIAGLNLNFNRVHFSWKRNGSGFELTMDARGERFLPAAYTARATLAERAQPIYVYSERENVEEWSVARGALNQAGSRWLPVRRPDLYAGDVFQTLARAQGLPLPNPVPVESLPPGSVLVEQMSDELRVLITDMLRYSTNITAEAVGMTTSARRGPLANHPASGKAMSDWLRQRSGAATARFVDHSGLGSASRISAQDMVGALQALGPNAGLRGLMKGFTMRDANGKAMAGHPIRVDAKTGTLNFISSLAGWATGPGGTDLVFAIFTGDVARRDAVPMEQRERPEGGKAWVQRARRLQQQLIERWVAVYG